MRVPADAPSLNKTEPAAHTSSRDLLRNLGYLAGSQVMTWSASLLYTVVVTRAIGPSGNGELSSATALMSILVTLVGFGSAIYLVRELAVDRARGPRLVATTLVVQGCLLPIGLGVTFIYVISGHFSSEMTGVFVIFGVSLIPSIISATLQAALQGIQRMGVIAASGAITSLLYNLVIVGLVLLGHRQVLLIASLVLVAQCGSLVVTFAVFRRHFELHWSVHLRAMVGVVRGSLPFLATAVAYTLYVAADTLILTTLSTPTEVGWYAAVNRLFGTFLVVSTIVSTAWLPRFSSHAAHDPTALRRETRLVVRLAFMSAIPLAVGGFLIAGRIIELIWGHAYDGAAAPMAVIMLSAPATSIATVAYQVLVARGLAGFWARVMAVALAANVAANIGLILWFRADGQSTALAAAICLNLTEAAMAVVAIWVLRHDLGLSTLWYAARAVLAGLVMGLVVVVAAQLPLGLVIMAGAATFLTAALALRLVTGEELLAVGTLARRVVRR